MLSLAPDKGRYFFWLLLILLFGFFNQLWIASWVKRRWSSKYHSLAGVDYVLTKPSRTVSEMTQETFMQNIDKEIENSYNEVPKPPIVTFMISYFPPPVKNYTFTFDPVSNLSSAWKNSSTFMKNVKKLKTILTRTHPERCDKIIFIGGWSCGKRKDGVKPVCFDRLRLADNESCLVYSFGSGNEFSFEKQMSAFGCQTFAFDDDQAHRNYPSLFNERFLFFNVRLGSLMLIEDVKYLDEREDYIFLSRPLDNIMYLLGHGSAYIDVLKIDIEGSEWNVFYESLCKLNILQKIGQLIIELHLDAFLNMKNTSEETLTSTVQKYNWIFEQCLIRNGFELIISLPNQLRPTVSIIKGFTIELYYEQLWINTRFNPPSILKQRTYNPKEADHYASKLEIY